MAEQNCKKRQRSGRATAEQYGLMLDFFVSNKGLAEGKITALHGRDVANKKWEELETLLNSARGPKKNVAQWQSAWRDLKSRTSVKARDRRKEMAATGGKPLTQTPLSDLDLRVLGILGAQYVEVSSNCADSLPEEECIQISLEAGQNDELHLSPTIPNCLQEIVEVALAEEVEGEVEQLGKVDAQCSPVAEKEASTRKRSRVLHPSACRIPKKRIIFESARDQFSQIAKQQADAMTMQAEAAKMQAEAALLQSQAFNHVASALELLANAIKPIAQTLGNPQAN